jgi:hypothetical protein
MAHQVVPGVEAVSKVVGKGGKGSAFSLVASVGRVLISSEGFQESTVTPERGLGSAKYGADKDRGDIISYWDDLR